MYDENIIYLTISMFRRLCSKKIMLNCPKLESNVLVFLAGIYLNAGINALIFTYQSLALFGSLDVTLRTPIMIYDTSSLC